MSKKNQKGHRWLMEMTSNYVNDHIEGDSFVECGVKQGTVSRIMAVVLQRQGYLFDTWTGFPHYSKKYDVPNRGRISRLNRRVRGMTSTYKQCKKTLKNSGVDRLCKMIKGDICKTVPDFRKKYSPSICMMHIDTDLHDPALKSITHFHDCVSKDGFVVFHDYRDVKWPGITKVVDNFVKEHSWFFLDMNVLFGIKAAVIINGSSDKYEEYIKQEWKL